MEPLISICLQIAILIVLIILLTKKNSLTELRAVLSSLHEALVRSETKSDQLNHELRQGIQEIRGTISDENQLLRTISTQSTDAVRNEVTTLRDLLAQNMQALTDVLSQRYVTLAENINEKQTKFQQEIADQLGKGQTSQTEQTLKMKETVENTLSQLGRDIRESSKSLTDEVKNRLQEVTKQLENVSKKNEEKQDSLRQTVEARLEKLQESNSAKLEEMRTTVDEKLHTTLEKRLTESFGLVTDQLGKVQIGLGEMKDLATGVGDLKRVLTNVKARGGLGEVMLEAHLDQILTADQYIKNAKIKPNSLEAVEYAIRIPNGEHEEVLLPIDAKFPKEDWEKLEDAMQHGSAGQIAAARKNLETTVRAEAKKISEKYVFPPVTTPFAFMFLSTEGLFAEVVRIPGLVSDLHSKFRVSITGPTNFTAMLSALQMGFRTVAIQKKGAEVWQILSAAKHEFGNFGTLMAKVEGQVQTVQNTLEKIHSKTKTINRKLKDVDTLEMQPVAAASLLGFEDSEDEDSGAEVVAEIAATVED